MNCPGGRFLSVMYFIERSGRSTANRFLLTCPFPIMQENHDGELNTSTLRGFSLRYGKIAIQAGPTFRMD